MTLRLVREDERPHRNLWQKTMDLPAYWLFVFVFAVMIITVVVSCSFPPQPTVGIIQEKIHQDAYQYSRMEYTYAYTASGKYDWVWVSRTHYEPERWIVEIKDAYGKKASFDVSPREFDKLAAGDCFDEDRGKIEVCPLPTTTTKKD